MTPPTRISRFGFVNAYLVREEDGFTLVDTMIPRSAKSILGAARDAGAPIVRIALTHAFTGCVESVNVRTGSTRAPRNPDSSARCGFATMGSTQFVSRWTSGRAFPI